MNLRWVLLLAILNVAMCQNNGTGCVPGQTDINECKGQACPKSLEDQGKSQLVAFLLYFFVGIYGAGDFYMGLPDNGVAKILMFVIPCYGVCCLQAGGLAAMGVGNDSAAAAGMSGMAVGLCCLNCVIFAMAIWNLVDWITLVSGDKFPPDTCLIMNM